MDIPPMVMAIPMLMDTDTTTLTIMARDPLSPVMDILIMVMVMLTMVMVMDMDTPMASKFILLT